MTKGLGVGTGAVIVMEMKFIWEFPTTPRLYGAVPQSRIHYYHPLFFSFFLIYLFCFEVFIICVHLFIYGGKTPQKKQILLRGITAFESDYC